MTNTDANREFRNALGTFTTGVTVVTTLDAKNCPVGMTVNSFASVSLEPPLVLWSLGEASRYCNAFMNCQHFAISVLNAEQKMISQLFASPDDSKFDQIDWSPGYKNLPLIDNCIAHFQCTTENTYPGGDHIIFVGRVLEFSYNSSAPLAFNCGQYYTLK